MSLQCRNFAATGDSLGEVFDFLSQRCEELGIGRDLKLKLHLAAEELFTNIVKYSPGAPPVSVGLQRRGAEVELSIEDHGPAYNPFEQTAADDPGMALAERKVGGLGLLLVQTLAARQDYVRNGDANRLILWFTATDC